MRKILWALLFLPMIAFSMPMPIKYCFIRNVSNETVLITVKRHDNSRYYIKDFKKIPMSPGRDYGLFEMYAGERDYLNTPDHLLNRLHTEVEILIIYDEQENIVFELSDIDETYFDLDTHYILITQEIIDRQLGKQTSW